MADAPEVRVEVEAEVCAMCYRPCSTDYAICRNCGAPFPFHAEGDRPRKGIVPLTGLDALAVVHMRAMRAQIAAALKLDALPRNSRDWTQEHEGVVDAFEAARTDERLALAALDTAVRAALLAEGGKDG